MERSASIAVLVLLACLATCSFAQAPPGKGGGAGSCSFLRFLAAHNWTMSPCIVTMASGNISMPPQYTLDTTIDQHVSARMPTGSILIDQHLLC